MNSSAPVILARSAGRMWLGAPALAVLFTCSAANAAATNTEGPTTAALTKALLRTVEEQATAVYAGPADRANGSNATYERAAQNSDALSAERVNYQSAHETEKIVFLASQSPAPSIWVDVGHASPPTAAP